jgi:hypothetical protein
MVGAGDGREAAGAGADAVTAQGAPGARAR